MLVGEVLLQDVSVGWLFNCCYWKFSKPIRIPPAARHDSGQLWSDLAIRGFIQRSVQAADSQTGEQSW
jgi:hypothetical protein